MASADFDGDGDVDVYVGNWPNYPGPGEPNRLFVNQVTGHNWLRVRLVGTKSNRSGIGARVAVTARISGKLCTQIREVHSHSGFRGQSDLVQHFGLGKTISVMEVTVDWPSGETSRLEKVEPNGEIVITE
jgi:hypothetical protein